MLILLGVGGLILPEVLSVPTDGMIAAILIIAGVAWLLHKLHTQPAPSGRLVTTIIATRHRLDHDRPTDSRGGCVGLMFIIIAILFSSPGHKDLYFRLAFLSVSTLSLMVLFY